MPTSSNGKHPRSRGRTGAKWQHARRRVLGASQICAFQGNDRWPPCGELIDMSLSWPDPRSPSVDHKDDAKVSDLAWDDPRLYDPQFLQPMHLVCNQRKNDGGMNKVEHPTSRDWRL